MDQRFVELKNWLEGELPSFDGFKCDEWQLLPVSGDASFRRYFRALSGGCSWIAVDAPPEKENSRPFVAVAKTLEQQGVHVPHVYLADYELGFMLLSDLGDNLYLPQLNADSVDLLYAAALDELLKIQACDAVSGMALPSYDEALLSREMELFRDWFLSQLLGLSLSEVENKLLDRFFSSLVKSALEQNQVFVHRDYHSRNLMYQHEGSPGVIDFQDAVRGPVTYDLVSLLRDCYIAWPDEQVYGWVEGYRKQLLNHGLNVPDEDVFQSWFDLMGTQRHLKAIGIFARLNIRDGKPSYLQDIPRTFSYMQKVASKTPELSDVAKWLDSEVVPHMYRSGVWSDTELDQWVRR